MKRFHLRSQFWQAFAHIILVCGFSLSFHAKAQMDHSVGMTGSSASKVNQGCQGSGLDCANAATPFLTGDGALSLVWSANGVVSVAQSSDLGKTFNDPIKIGEHGKSLDAGSDARPQIVADSRGNVFIAYAFFKDSNWNAQINTSQSRDGGKTFSKPKPLVSDSSSQRFPSALIRPDDSIFLAWIDKRLVAKAKQAGQPRLGGSIAYAFSEDGGARFSPEKIANESSCECCRIGSSIDPKGDVVVVYRAIFPGGIRDHATQVLTPVETGKIERVSHDQWRTDACPHHGPSIAISGTGKIHVAWYTQGSARSGVFYANSSNQGRTYSTPDRIGSETSNVSRPYLLAIDRNVWMVWKEFDGQHTFIMMKYSEDDGVNWSKPIAIAQTADYSDHPLLISQGKAVFLSWLTRANGYQFIKIGQGK